LMSFDYYLIVLIAVEHTQRKAPTNLIK